MITYFETFFSEKIVTNTGKALSKFTPVLEPTRTHPKIRNI